MVLATDTAAVPEADTAPVAVEAPPVEETPQPETAQTPGSETETQAAPEPEVADPYAGLDPEKLFEHPVVKARLARETESVRRTSERATEQRVQQARSDWVASGQAFSEIQTALDTGNTQQAQAIIGAALANRDWTAVGTLDRIARSKLPEGAKVSAEDIEKLDQALDAARRGTGTLDAYADAMIEVRAKQYAESVLLPQVEARVQREAQAKAKAAAKTAGQIAAEATNDAQGRPTLGVPGSGGQRVLLTSQELDSIPTNTFLNLPKETQQKLVSEAREADRMYPGRNDRSMVQRALGR